ncbi:MAG: hypothetical protein ABFS56_01325 [Pseudomonadota bacterium]
MASVNPVAADTFVYEPGESRLHNKCLANFNRGKKCHALLNRLCNRIQNKNTECRILRVEQCHKKHRKAQTKAEKICEHGSHKAPCYGISKKCRYEEHKACTETNYQLRFCAYYKWQYCRRIVGKQNGEFQTKDCRVFHNKEMIKFYERKISKALQWQPRGENNIEQSLALKKAQRQQMREQLRQIKKQEKSLQGLIGEMAEQFVSELRKQQRELKKQKRQLRDKISKLNKQIDEYAYMGGLCKKLGHPN